jgi:hypothetical protein
MSNGEGTMERRFRVHTPEIDDAVLWYIASARFAEAWKPGFDSDIAIVRRRRKFSRPPLALLVVGVLAIVSCGLLGATLCGTWGAAAGSLLGAGQMEWLTRTTHARKRKP